MKQGQDEHWANEGFKTARRLHDDAYFAGFHRGRHKERELEEYVDRLKYIKNKRLYEEYRRRAWLEDGVDVEAVLATDLNDGDKRGITEQFLMDMKKNLKL